MKIALVELGLWNPGKYARHSALEPIAIEYVGSAAKSKGHNVRLFQQRTESNEELTNKILGFEPDLVGFSAMTYAFPDGLEIAGRIKQKNPDVYTVFGGYHASSTPEIVQYDSIDFTVIGEGENALVELVQKLENNEEVSNIKGLSYFNGSEVISNQLRERIDLDNQPWPIREERFFKNTLITGITDPPIGKQKIAQISYSRGCPFHCKYCASPNVYGSAVKWRKAENVTAEIKYLKDNFNVNLLYFTDLTFNLNKERVFELNDLLKEEKINWIAMASPDINIDYDLLREMKEAGCTRLMYGIESVHDRIAESVGRKGNHRAKRLEELFRINDELGIITRAFLMIGNLNETKEDIKGYLDTLKKILPDEIRIGITTPLPGTALFEEAKRHKLLIYTKFPEDWKRYSTEELIIRHPTLSPKEISQSCGSIFRDYYESEEYGRHVKRKIEKFPNLQDGYSSFFTWLKEQAVDLT